MEGGYWVVETRRSRSCDLVVHDDAEMGERCAFSPKTVDMYQEAKMFVSCWDPSDEVRDG